MAGEPLYVQPPGDWGIFATPAEFHAATEQETHGIGVDFSELWYDPARSRAALRGALKWLPAQAERDTGGTEIRSLRASLDGSLVPPSAFHTGDLASM